MYRRLDYWNDDELNGRFVGIFEALGCVGIAFVVFGLLVWAAFFIWIASLIFG